LLIALAAHLADDVSSVGCFSPPKDALASRLPRGRPPHVWRLISINTKVSMGVITAAEGPQIIQKLYIPVAAITFSIPP
jgi:hypothetical protein